MPFKITKDEAVQALKKEAFEGINHFDEVAEIWEQKLAQIDLLPEWYLKMFWYAVFTENIEII